MNDSRRCYRWSGRGGVAAWGMVLAALAALAGCGGAGSPPATVSGAAFQEFVVPVAGSDPADPHPGAWPDDLAGDAAGNVWFAMHHADEIGRMSPAGVYTGFPVPTRGAEMDGVVVDDARRTVWVSQVLGNHIVRLDMDTGAVQELPVPSPRAFPGDLALGADGAVWFAEAYDSDPGAVARLGRVDPATNAVTEVALPVPRGTLDGILVDAAGAVWFTEFADHRIARYAGGVFQEFELPSPAGVPTNIATDASGNIWITDQGTNTIRMLNPATGRWRSIPIPSTGASPAGIVVDGRGNVWFTETLTNRIGVLPAGATRIQEFELPHRDSYPEDIRIIAGRVMFTERYGNRIAAITVPGITP